MTTRPTLKAIGFTALFGALLASGAAFADEQRGLLYGAYTSDHGITLPAGASVPQAPRSQAGDGLARSESSLYGVFVRDANGTVLPRGVQPASVTAAGAPVAAARHEVLFGNFVKIDGIALPATPGQLRDNGAIRPATELAEHDGR